MNKANMIMTDKMRHVSLISSFLLVGVPSNVAVLWIHTRKNSRVAKNRFPLIFVALDLCALVTALPLIQYAFETNGKISHDNAYLNTATSFTINGYLMTLFMATIDKFYAVMFPFKYGKRRSTIFKTAIAVTTIPNAVLAIAIATSFEIFGPQVFTFMVKFYHVTFALMFLITKFLYILIIAKLFRNQRNLREVTNNSG